MPLHYNKASLNSTGNATVMNYDLVAQKIKWLIFSYVTASNLLLIISLLRTNRRKKLSLMKKLFVFLSCTDMLTISLFLFHNYIEESNDGEIMIGALCQMLYLMGCTIFLTISVLRYISVRYPLKKVSNRTVYLTLLVAFILGVVNGAINFVEESFNLGKLGYIFVAWWLLIFFIEILLMALTSILSWRYLSQFQNFIDHNERTDAQNTASLSKKKYAVKTLIYITISYVTCNLCLLGCILLQPRLASRADGDVQIILGYIVDILYSFVLANTGNNAVIYLLRSKDLRAFYWKNILTCCRKGKKDDEVSTKKDRQELGFDVQESQL